MEQARLLKEGDHFGDYVVLKLLGKGGMGAVYLMQSPSGKKFAVKIMFPSGVTHEMRRRFAQEADFAMRIRHRNLISVYDVGEDPDTGLCYIIMDYVPGGSLADRLKARGRFSLEEAVHVFSQIAAALDVAHQRGVVHRDIKPDNIMFDADGTPKLADLGIAKFEEGQASMVTTTGAIVGTPAYMSPEQMMNSHEIDARADIYSLGVVLYEMLTGKRANDGISAVEIMARAIKGEPLPDARSVCPDLPESVAYVLSSLCSPDPDDRPRTAVEAADMLRGAVNGDLVLEEKEVPDPEAAAENGARSEMRRRRMLLSAAVAGLALLLSACAVGLAKILGGPGQGKPDMPAFVTNIVRKTVFVTNVVERVVVATNLPPTDKSIHPESAPQAKATLSHRWSFNGRTDQENLVDSVSGAVATRIGNAVEFKDGQAVMFGNGHGAGSLNLGKGILGGDSATVEIWATRTAFKCFARLFDYGVNDRTYCMVTWAAHGFDNIRTEILKNRKLGRSTQGPAPWKNNEEFYIAVMFTPQSDGNLAIKWVVYDPATGEKKDWEDFHHLGNSIRLIDLVDANFYIGHSQYDDPDANAKYNEVRVWKGVLSDEEIARNVQLGPNATTAELHQTSEVIKRPFHLPDVPNMEISQ